MEERQDQFPLVKPPMAEPPGNNSESCLS